MLKKILLLIILGNFLGLCIIATGYYVNHKTIEESKNYNFFSEIEEVHCPVEECPGENCLCIIGDNKTWYLNETIGDIEELDAGMFTR